MNWTDGVYIAFSTGPGQTAIDIGDTAGPFARALAIELVRPGRNHRDVFASIRRDVFGETRTQRPWLEDGIVDDVYFADAGSQPAIDTSAVQAPNPQADAPFVLPGLQPIPSIRRSEAAIAPPLESAISTQPCGSRAAVVSRPHDPPYRCHRKRNAVRPKDVFQECDNCPRMVVVPAGSFTMGSPESELGRSGDEGPQHVITIAQQFAVAQTP